MMSTVPTFCRMCNKACPMIATVVDGRLVRVTGDPDNPLYERYTCVKGRQAPTFANHPERLLHSLRRAPDGRFEPVRFDDAMDDIAARLQTLVDRHGPRSVAVYTGTQLVNVPAGALITSFLQQLGSPMRFEAFTIDKPGRAIAWSLLGHWRAPHVGFHDPKVALMVGINPLVNGIGGLPLGHPTTWLTRRLRDGMQLIVIDPRRSDVAKRATLHLAPRPGHDIALLAAMLHVILAEDRYDHEFVAEHVSGLDALRTVVARFTPGPVADAADVPVDDLVRAARLFASAGRGFGVAGTGPHMAASGTLLEYLVLTLDTVCGHWMRAGEVVANPGVLSAPVEYVAEAEAPDPTAGASAPTRVRGFTGTVAGMPTSTLAEEILTPGPGRVRALISVGGNPVAAFPDEQLTVKALRSLDLLVQVDPWLSQTARLADYVIAPRQWVEMAGTTEKLERVPRVYATGYAWPGSYAHVTPPVVEPPAGSEVVEDWEVFYALGRRMGLQLSVTPAAGPAVPLDMERAPASDDLLELLSIGARVPLADVRAKAHGGFFPTDSPTVVRPASATRGRLEVGNADMMRGLQATGLEGGGPEGYPFRLLVRRMPHIVNSTFNDLATNRGRGYNPAFMHPKDAAALGLADGDAVTLSSQHASIPAVAHGDRDVRPGTISMSFGFGGHDDDDDRFREVGSSTARLVRVDDDADPFSGQPRMSNIPVKVERR
jgi:anaerobic selenocysteine-containing dehydrogenase